MSPGLEPKRLLSRLRRLDMNAFQLEHADLGRRAAWRGKTTNLAAGRQDPVAGDDQRHRVLCHRLTDIARGLWPGAEFLRQSAISGRVAPSNPPRRSIDSLEECVLLTEVEPEAGKIHRLALEITLHSSDRLDHLWRGRARLGARDPAQQNSFGRFGASCRQLEARDAHLVPGDAAEAPCGFKDQIMVRCLAHQMAFAFRSIMEIVGRGPESTRFVHPTAVGSLGEEPDDWFGDPPRMCLEPPPPHQPFLQAARHNVRGHAEPSSIPPLLDTLARQDLAAG